MIPEKKRSYFFLYFDTHHHSWIFSISILFHFYFVVVGSFLILCCMSSEFNLIPTAPTVYPHQNVDHSLFSYQFVGDGVDAVAVAVLVGDLVVIGTFVGDLVGGDTVGELVVVIGTFVVGLVLGAVVGRFVGRFVGRQPDLVQSEFPEPKVGLVVGDLAVDEVGEGVVGEGVGSGTGTGIDIGDLVQSGFDLVHAEFPEERLGLLLLLLLPSAFILFISPPIDARER